MTELQYKKIKEHIQKKENVSKTLNEKKRLAELQRTTELLRPFFANINCQVYIFGSLIHEGTFTQNSDIDIAIANCSQNRIDLYCELSDLLQRRIDLVILERSNIKDYILNNCIQII